MDKLEDRKVEILAMCRLMGILPGIRTINDRGAGASSVAGIAGNAAAEGVGTMDTGT